MASIQLLPPLSRNEPQDWQRLVELNLQVVHLCRLTGYIQLKLLNNLYFSEQSPCLTIHLCFVKEKC